MFDSVRLLWGGGRWPVAGGPVAGDRWPVAGGAVAGGRWAGGAVAGGRWALAGGRWAGGRWPLTKKDYCAVWVRFPALTIY